MHNTLAYVSLALCVLFSAAFLHIIRFSQQGGRSTVWLGAFNYVVATISCAIWAGCRPGLDRSYRAVFGLAVLGGVCFLLSYLLMTVGIRRAGVGITTACARLAVAVPVAGSILIWGEFPTAIQGVGLALALFGMVLFLAPRGKVGAPSHATVWAWAAPAALLAVSGLAQLLFKVFAQWDSPGGSPAFLAVVFGSAGMGNLVLAASSKEKCRVRDLGLGAALGLANVLSNFTLLSCLAVLPGTLVFPVTSVGTILLGALAAAWLWKERYGPLHLAGFGFSIVSILLITLGG